MVRRPFALVAAALLGCSSIPDVVFEDAAATSGGTSGGASRDGGASSGGGVRCPERPPPASEGRCCGSHVCVGCNDSQCARCSNGECGDDAVCIARGNGNSVECRR